MIALLIVLTHLAAFFLGASIACFTVAILVIRAAGRAEQPRRVIRGHDGADLDVEGLMDSVSER